MPRTHSIQSMPYKDFSLKIHEQAGSQHQVVKAQLELTYRCNLHCVHCYTDPYNSRKFFPRELTLTEIKQLCDDMAEIGILWLNLTGGEIFSHPQFFDIYDYAYRKGFLLQLYTNGTILTKGIIDRLAQSPPFTIDVSCHSVQEEAFEQFTQVPGSFKQFMKGMELLRHSGLPFSFKTKAMNWNKSELSDIKTFVESFGQPFGFTTSLSPRLNGDCSSLEYRLHPKDIERLEQTNSQMEDDSDCTQRDEYVSPPTNRLFRCGCATNTIHVNAWGELGTCTMEYEHRVSLRQHSLLDAIRIVFEAVQAARYSTQSPCQACQVYSYCEKKPTEARWERGHAEEPIPYYCDVAFQRAQGVTFQPLIHPLQSVKGNG